MRLIRTSEESGTIAVELEGGLDAVTAYDLRVTLEELPGQGRHHISLDLTRVQRADDDGSTYCAGARSTRSVPVVC